MERYSKWDKELEERAHVQEGVQNSQSEHGGSRHLKNGDGVPASGVHHIRRTILPKRSYVDHWRELHKNKNKNKQTKIVPVPQKWEKFSNSTFEEPERL